MKLKLPPYSKTVKTLYRHDGNILIFRYIILTQRRNANYWVLCRDLAGYSHNIFIAVIHLSWCDMRNKTKI